MLPELSLVEPKPEVLEGRVLSSVTSDRMTDVGANRR